MIRKLYLVGPRWNHKKIGARYNIANISSRTTITLTCGVLLANRYYYVTKIRYANYTGFYYGWLACLDVNTFDINITEF